MQVVSCRDDWTPNNLAGDMLVSLTQEHLCRDELYRQSLTVCWAYLQRLDITPMSSVVDLAASRSVVWRLQQPFSCPPPHQPQDKHEKHKRPVSGLVIMGYCSNMVEAMEEDPLPISI